MVEEIPLKEKIDRLYAEKYGDVRVEEEVKTKKIKLKKAKVKKRRIKKNWIGILRIDENGNISGERQKVEDMTFKLKNGTYHTTNGDEVLFWEGKYPVIVQPTWKLNPITLRKDVDTNNETYGQKYVMARMLKDVILTKGKGASMIIWIVVIIALFVAAKYIFKF